jgi:hypothetical protein
MTSLLDFSQQEVLRCVDSISGRKTLVVDASLSALLSLVCDVKTLREHGVDKIHHLHTWQNSSEIKICVICRPNKNNLSKIENLTTKDSQISVFFVPQRSLLCDRLIHHKGITADIHIGELHLDIINIEHNVLSLEMKNSFADIFLVTLSNYRMAKHQPLIC